MCVYVIMMTKYNQAKKVLKKYNGRILNTAYLRSIIIKYLGGDERTINGYLMVMRDSGLMRETEHLHFLIEVEDEE